MADFVIYHNPRCSKSRQTLALLEENGINPSVVEYLKTPPSTDELKHILDKLGLKARDIMRTKESEYKAAGMDNPELSEDELIRLLCENPKVIERPIVVHGKRAVIGRPPENVLALINA